MKKHIIYFCAVFFAGFILEANGQQEDSDYKDFKQRVMHPELYADESADIASVSSKSFSPSYGDAPAWNWKYHFGGTVYDYAEDIISDADGNIYITGHFSGEISIEGNNYSGGGSSDAFVAKFDASGGLLWFNHINAGPQSDEIKAYGICLDASGNVYVTGNYTGSVDIGVFTLADNAANNLFYAKFDTNGNVINAVQYGGEGETLIGLTITTDISENVYIIGYTENSIYSRKPSVILKYSAAGDFVWNQYHDESFDDMVVSGSDIYFTGSVQSHNDGYFDGVASVMPPTGYHDIFYAKTDLDGNFAWANILTHESSGDSYEAFLSTDISGDIYMSGRFRSDIVIGGNALYGSSSGFISKFNSAGAISWATVIDDVSPTSLCADETGNSYVTCGNSIYYYNTTGEIQWTRELPYSPTAITINASNNYFTCGTFYGLMYFNKLQGETTELWNVKFDGNSGTAYIIGSVADDQGYIYSYGNISNGADYNGIEVDGGIFFCKQTLDGQVIWLNQFADTYMGYGSQGNYLNIDTVNNFLYVTGQLNYELVIPGQTTHTPIEGGGMILLKYDLDGNYVWSLQEDFNVDVPSVVPDQSGNVIVSGTFSDTIMISTTELESAGDRDGFIAKYNSTGSLLWAKRAGGEGTEWMAITTIDASDNIFLSGEFTSTDVTVDATEITLNEGDGNIIFSKLNASGDVQWVKAFANSPAGNDGNCWPTGIKVDNLDNVYLKGWHGDEVYFDGILLNSSYSANGKFIAKIDNNGNALWAKSINEEYPGFDYNQFDFDNEGNIYIGLQIKAPIHFEGEYDYAPNANNNLAVIKYLSNGELSWVKTLPSSGGYNWISSIAVVDNENIIVSGLMTYGLSFDYDEIYAPLRHGFIAALKQDILSEVSPVVHYPFNGNANDESSSGYHGTVTEAALTTDRFGKPDSAYYFDGINDYINCGTGLNLVNGSDQLTITAWINPELLNEGQNTILSERDGGDNYQFAIMDNDIYFSFWKPDNSELLFYGNDALVKTDFWQFVAITYNGYEVSLFYNGELNASEPASGIINSNSSQLQIGTYTPNDGMFQGNLDDIRIYNQALSSEMIHALYYENGYEPPVNFNTKGLVEDFEDLNTDGWAGNVYALDVSEGDLQVTGNTTEWDSFYFNFPEVLNLSENPYLSIRIKSDQDVNLWCAFHDIHGYWTSDNIPGFNVVGNGEYQEFIMDYSQKWRTWQGELVDPANLTVLDFVINPGEDFNGTIYIDDILIGDQVPVSFAEATFNVDMNYQILLGLFDTGNDNVYLPGSFNSWVGEEQPLTDDDADGIYTATRNNLLIGDTYEYKYKTDSEWEQFDAGNRMLHVIGDTILNHWFNDDVTGEVPLQLSYNLGYESEEGAADGSIDLHVYGGIPPYTFAWSNGETTEDIFDLTSGIYTVVVTDSDLAEATIDVEISLEPISIGEAVSFISTEIELDGRIDLEWDNAVQCDIAKPFSGDSFNDETDLAAYWKAAWNEGGLYILVHVTADDFHVTDGSYGASYEQDMIEIHLDMNWDNLEDGMGANTGPESGHYQIALLGEADAPFPEWFWGDRGFELYEDNSYIQELFIAWDNIPNSSGEVFTPNGDFTFGFDVNIADNDGSDNGAARNRMVWVNDGNGPTSTENWFNMDDAGELAFNQTNPTDNNIFSGLYNSNVTYERIGVISADHQDMVKVLEPITQQTCRTYMGLWPSYPLYITIIDENTVTVETDPEMFSIPLHDIDWGTSSYNPETGEIHLFYGYTIDGGERKFEELYTFFHNDTIIINSPTAQESWNRTWRYDISWIDNMGTEVTIELFKDSLFVDNIIENIENTGHFDWIIPAELEPGIDYQVNVSMVSGTVVNAFSEEFEIAEEPYLGSVVDYDGNVYNTVKIGNQLWMQENLKTTHFADGSPISDGNGLGDNCNDISTKYFYDYENDPGMSDMAGKLYNWAAVMNGEASSNTIPSFVQGVCPTDWHVPSNAEWFILTDELGGQEIAGGKLKGFDHWNDPNTGATNESGFSALPAGARICNGSFENFGSSTNFWSSTLYGSNEVYGRGLSDTLESLQYDMIAPQLGSSVRCVKDPLMLTVTLNVNMTEPIVNGEFIEGSDTLWLASSLNAWIEPGNDLEMELKESSTNDIYTVSLLLQTGEYEYKYFKNSGWVDGEWGGEPNRTFTLDTTNIVIDDIWGPEPVKPIDNVNLSYLSIPHNIPNNAQVGIFEVAQEQSFPAYDFNYAYELVSGVGDDDNDLFKILDSSLYTNSWLNINEQSSYTIRVGVSDGLGSAFEKILVLTLIESDWKTQNAQIQGGIDEIYVIDENMVWAMDQKGDMVRTTNGGDSWENVNTFDLDNLSMGAFFAINADVAWRIGSWAASGTAEATGIYKTIDGGKTWTLNPDVFHEPGSFPNFVHFWNENDGFCAGDSYNLFTTNNGGTTWNAVSNLPQENGNQLNATSTYSVIGDTIWYVTNGMIGRSPDKGYTWEGFNSDLFSTGGIAFKDALNGLMIERTGKLLKTVDGAESWIEILPEETFSYTVLKYDFFTNRYVTGCYGNTGIHYSYDDGLTWVNDDAFIFNERILGIDFYNESTAWAGGYDGNVYKYVGSEPIVTIPTANFTYVVNTDSVSFTNLSINADNVNWTFGDGAQSQEINPIHIYNNAGFYNVCLTVFDTESGESDEYCVEIVVGENSQICKAEFEYSILEGSVTFVNTSESAFTHYTWDFGDGAFSNQASPGHVYTESGFYAITLTGFDSIANCYDESYAQILIEIDEEVSCSAEFKAFVDGANSVFINQSLGSFTNAYWSFGNGAYVSAMATDTVDNIYEESGYYEVCLMIFDSVSGCLDEYCEEILIVINQEVVCKSDFNYFVNDTVVTFTSLAQGDITNYMWNFDDGEFSFVENPSHTFSESGYYNVEFTVYDSVNNCLESRNKVITIIKEEEVPLCKAAFDVFIDQNNVVFSNISTGNYTNVYWDYGDGTFSTQDDSMHVYNATDYYEVSLTIYDAETEHIDEFTKVLMVVKEAEVALCKSQFTYFNNENTLTFNNQSIGETTDFFWNFGNGNYSFDENPEHYYTESGYFEVSLTIYDSISDCLDESIEVVLIESEEIASCNAQFTYYPDAYSVTFTSEATGEFSQHFWDFNDGTNSNQEDPVHVYAEPGYYEVAYTIIDTLNGCFDTRFEVVFVEGELGSGSSTDIKARYSYIPSSESNEVVFSDESLGNIITWYWDFGDNSLASAEQNPVYTYDKNDYYRVCLTASNDEKQETRCDFVAAGDVSNSSTAYFTYFADSLTSTGHFKNRSLGNIVSYSWDFGDGYTTDQKNPSHTYADTGYYAVCLLTTSTIGVHKTYCDDIRIGNALDNPCLFSCVWPGDANNDLEANHYDIMTIGLNYNLSGPMRENASMGWYGQFAQNWSTYQLDGTNNKYGDANGDGSINFDDVEAIETNFAYSHTEQPNNKSVDWNIICTWANELEGNKRNADIILLPPENTKAGEIYAIAYEIEIVGGEKLNWDAIAVSFDESWLGVDEVSMLTMAELDAGKHIIYIGMTRIDQQDVTGSGKLGEIAFTFKDNLEDTEVSFNVNTQGGIVSSGEDVTVGGNIQLALSSPVYVCNGETVILDAGSGFKTYSWSTGTADTSRIEATKAGLYIVTVTNESGASATDTIELIINELPLVSVGADTTITTEQTIVLDAGLGFEAYLWSTDETTQTIELSGTLLGVGKYDYSVLVTDANSCQNTDTVTVTVQIPDGTGEISTACKVYPNPVNKVLTIENNSSIEMIRLFDASGKLVLIKENINQSLFSVNMESFKQGVYLLNIIDNDGASHMVRIFKN